MDVKGEEIWNSNVSSVLPVLTNSVLAMLSPPYSFNISLPHNFFLAHPEFNVFLLGVHQIPLSSLFHSLLSGLTLNLFSAQPPHQLHPCPCKELDRKAGR